MQITQKYLKECFDYNPETGDLIWRIRPESHFKKQCSCKSWNTRYAKSKVGTVNRTTLDSPEYLFTCVNSKSYRVHRLIWFLVYGYWPDQIDHINGNGLDNRLSNLRNVDNHENAKNQKLSIKNKSGVVGVHWNKSKNKWQSSIRVNGRQICLGRFHNKTDAIIARKMAEYEHGFHENHGRILN